MVIYQVAGDKWYKKGARWSQASARW